MSNYHLDMLTGVFQSESIRKLQYVFTTLADPGINAANTIRLKQTFLSIVEQEQLHNNTPIANSPDGMNFIYCLWESAQYILLNPYGIIPIFHDVRIYDGELGVRNVKWFEEDHLVTFEVYYIVRNLRQTCICHFPKDGNAFTYFTEIKSGDHIPIWGEDPPLWL